MELFSVLCDSLDGRGVWRRMDTCIYITEFLPCSPETVTTLLTGYTSIQNKKFFKNVSLTSRRVNPWLEEEKEMDNCVLSLEYVETLYSLP